MVTLHRYHTYTDIDAIQGELSTKVMELAPPNFKVGTKVCFIMQQQSCFLCLLTRRHIGITFFGGGGIGSVVVGSGGVRISLSGA